MRIILVGSGEPLSQLLARTQAALGQVPTGAAVSVETTDDPAYHAELGIKANPAFCIEEETIDFRDMIFEGEVPEEGEIRLILRSILGSDEEMHGGCDACGAGCSTGACATGCGSHS